MANDKSQNELFLQLELKIDKLSNCIDSLKEKQDEMTDHVTKIKEAVYNPDQGLYARLRELESWKSTSSKMIWTLFTTMVCLIGAFVLKSF